MIAYTSTVAQVSNNNCAYHSLSLDELFRAHMRDVYRVVARLLGPGASEADLEDLTQQVFLAAHRGWKNYRGEGKPTTWLYGISSRVVCGYLRSRKRQRRLREALEACPVEMLQASDADPEAQVANREQLRVVWRVLMNIKVKKRLVYILYELEGQSGADIAQALDIQEATVWTRLFHARRELARGLLKSKKQKTLLQPKEGSL